VSRKRSKFTTTLLVLLVCLTGVLGASAQDRTGLAATLEVLSAGVEVLRADTTNWVSVNLESIVGTGDTIRTDETGRARVTFFADGTATEILPSSEYRIEQFEGDETSFRLVLQVVIGQTLQTLGRVLDPSSEYQMITPAMTLSARGTAFAVRVEPTGRAGMLVSDGLVDANAGTENEDVPPGFGIRSESEEALSPVVRARTFEELDAALDGCIAQVNNADDVSYNIREFSSLDAPILATIIASDINRLFGITENGGWYLVKLDDQEGWIRASAVTIDSSCAGLRVFRDDGTDPPPESASSSSPTTL
jgi:hypothetical protein